MISLVRALFSPGLSPRSASLVAALMAVLVMTPSTGVAGAASPAAASASASASAAISTTVPRPSDVERGRFVTSIALDTGAFKVVPAPAHVRPDLTRAQAAKEIWASPTLQGFTQGPVGFGLVTPHHQTSGLGGLRQVFGRRQLPGRVVAPSRHSRNSRRWQHSHWPIPATGPF
jgi:hypothetical protein